MEKLKVLILLLTFCLVNITGAAPGNVELWDMNIPTPKLESKVNGAAAYQNNF